MTLFELANAARLNGDHDEGTDTHLLATQMTQRIWHGLDSASKGKLTPYIDEATL